MGACVAICGKKQEFMQEPQKKPIENSVFQEVKEQIKEQLCQPEPIIQKEILLELKNTEMTSSITRSWKTETKSRFYKQKSPCKSQASALQQNSETIKEPSSCYASDIMEKNTSKRFKRFSVTKQDQTVGQSSDQQSQASSNKKISSKEQIQVGLDQYIKIRIKMFLKLPKEGKSQIDKRLIQSTANIPTKILINEKIQYDDGSVYLGEWKRGMRHGHGALKWRDGCVYEGEWKKNMIEGSGALVYGDGQKYIGDFKKNQAHGKGEYHFLNGSKYVGEWVDSFPDGYGVQIYSKYQKFLGNWSKGKKNGYGELEFEDGTYFKGQFFNNELQGQGEYNYGDKVYKGYWEHNKKRGLGRMQWSDGSRYEGNFFDDKLHGKGKLYDKSGIIYQGKWVNGRKDGIFIEHRPDGQTVKTQWYYNKPVKQFEKKNRKIDKKQSVPSDIN